MSELEPQLIDRLTLKDNHTYYTSLYLIDDVTGELYACQGDDLIAIKEQEYLQNEMAEKIYLESQTARQTMELMKSINQQSEAVLFWKSSKSTTAI